MYAIARTHTPRQKKNFLGIIIRNVGWGIASQCCVHGVGKMMRYIEIYVSIIYTSIPTLYKYKKKNKYKRKEN